MRFIGCDSILTYPFVSKSFQSRRMIYHEFKRKSNQTSKSHLLKPASDHLIKQIKLVSNDLHWPWGCKIHSSCCISSIMGPSLYIYQYFNIWSLMAEFYIIMKFVFFRSIYFQKSYFKWMGLPEFWGSSGWKMWPKLEYLISLGSGKYFF